MLVWKAKVFNVLQKEAKRQSIGRLESSLRRRVNRMNVLMNASPTETVPSTSEMDTHADTCVLGPNFIILHYTGRECDVSPYTDVYDSVKSVPIVSGATAWTAQVDGLDYILVIYEGLWMPSTVKASLINPNQLRAHGTEVQDNPFGGTMFVKDTDETVMIPMCADGTNICINTRTPTQEELDTCPHIHLTSDREWDPNNIKFSQDSRCSQGCVYYSQGQSRSSSSRGVV
jgi:hypothetical protein